MVFQAILVFILCACLHFIVIGISGIKFKASCMNKGLFLTTFNDNQEELETKLVAASQKRSGDNSELLGIIREMQVNLTYKQKRLKKIYSLAIFDLILILLSQYH